MDLIRLIWRNLRRHWVRSVLTVASLVVALFLLLTLQTFLTGLSGATTAARSDRLWVQSAVSLFVQLPLNYPEKIEAVDGVEKTCKWQWFGGYYQDSNQFFAQFAVDPENFIEMYPEAEVIEGSAQTFIEGRQTALIGEALAKKFDWKVGDRVPIIGPLFPHPDGVETPWEFDIAGIYSPAKPTLDSNTLFFHWDLFQETREQGGNGVNVGAIVVKTEPGADQTKVMRSVDELFANGPQRVQSTTEAEFSAQFVTMFGNVPFFVNTIGMGVLLAILLACINTMLMAAREQVHDIGILKSLGFANRSIFGIMLAQSMLLCGLGGGLGILLALVTEKPLGTMTATFLPSYDVLPETVTLGVMITVGVGLIAGLYPAWRSSRLEAVDALKAEASSTMVPISYNLRSLWVRKSATLLTVIGIGATVAVMAGVLALQQGFARLYSENGREDLGVFLRPGATNEGDSQITRERAEILIKTLPDIAKNERGEPMASQECFLAVRRFKTDGGETNVPIRGVEQKTFEIRRDEVSISEGTHFTAGADEVIVGSQLQGRIQGAALGDVIVLNTTPFRVVGIMESSGTFASEIWGDLDRMLEALDRPNANRVIAELVPGTDIPALATRIEGDKQFVAKLLSEREYLSSQTVVLSTILKFLAGFLGVVMGIAAVFTATNTMLSAIASRTSEIGILLACGFRPLSIFVSFLFESLALGLVGGLVGCLMVLPINGIETGTTNFNTFTEVAFAFRVTPSVLTQAVAFAVFLGLLGGAIPAMRAAMLAPTDALRRG